MTLALEDRRTVVRDRARTKPSRSATQALTVLAPIDPERRAVLDARLAAIAKDLDQNALFRPKDLANTHFMRFVVIEARDNLPALLAWESNHDGHRTEYIDEVVHNAPIDIVFDCCVGFPKDPSARVEYLLEHAHHAAAFYAAYRGIPRDQVVNDRQVHDTIREELDRLDRRKELMSLPGREIQRRLCDHVRATRPDLDTSATTDQETRWFVAKVIAVLGGLLVLIPALIIFIPAYLTLRRKEKSDVADKTNRPVHDDMGFSQVEDVFTQNQLTHLVDVKPGWFRYATLWTFLTLIDVIARVYSVRGSLGGITSIHFARWVVIKDTWTKKGPKRHRLIFFSNYDFSWDSYLGEFVDRAAWGLTGVWSNTVRFPKTKNLYQEGARDEESFKQWARNHQIATQVWWSGIPDSTVQNVRDDIYIRRNLDRGLDDNELATWLRKL